MSRAALLLLALLSGCATAGPTAKAIALDCVIPDAEAMGLQVVACEASTPELLQACREQVYASSMTAFASCATAHVLQACDKATCPFEAKK